MFKNKLQTLSKCNFNPILKILFPILFLSTFYTNGQTYSWDMRGSLIDGNIYIGAEVDLSENGQIWAVFGNGVFKWHGNAYIQMGNRIDISALSANGRRGVTDNEVYEWNGSMWTPMGHPINEQGKRTISADGNRLVISDSSASTPEGSGKVSIYQWNGEEWILIGEPILGSNDMHYLGLKVALSANGNRLAVGGFDSHPAGDEKAIIQIYEWNGVTWTQIGANLNELEHINEGMYLGSFGYSIDFDSEGQRLLVGTTNIHTLGSGPTSTQGQIQVFEQENENWQQTGQTIEMHSPMGAIHVAISSDGNRISAISLGEANPGSVKTLDWNGTEWEELYSFASGCDNSISSKSIALSGDGKYLSIGAPDCGSNNMEGKAETFRLADMGFIRPGFEMCSNEGPPSLLFGKGIPVGGVYSGTGISYSNGVGFSFDPALVGVGSHEVIYTFDGYSDTIIVEVVDADFEPSLTLPDTLYITPGESSTLEGTGLPIGGVYEDDLGQFQDDGNGETFSYYGQIDVSHNNTIHYTFTDINGCQKTASKDVIVEINPDYDELIQLGSDFINAWQGVPGEATGTYYDKVDISHDGSRVIIGSPYFNQNGDRKGRVRIFDWNGQTWVQVGQDLIGENNYDRLGEAVAISGDGSRIFIGATGYGSGHGRIQVYEWDGNTWFQLGENIEGSGIADNLSVKISTNHDGNRMLIGSKHNQTNSGWPIGLVQVYEWNNNDWIQLGQSIIGDDTYRIPGEAISMSADGQTIAVSDTEMPILSQISKGRVRIFNWNGTNWILKGQALSTNEDYTLFGGSLSLSADGNRLAVGEAAFGFENGQHGPGKTIVYAFEVSEWTPLGLPIIGAGEGSFLGQAISLSYDGNRLAIGEPRFDNGTERYGRVQLFEFNESDWDKTTSDIIKPIEGHKIGYNLALSGDGYSIAVGGSVRHNGSPPAVGRCHTSVYRFAKITSFFLGNNTYCVQDDSQYPLTGGWPDSGVYSGDGVIFNNFLQAYIFNPAIAGVGHHTLTYTVDELHSDSITVEVFGPPMVSLNLPDTLYLNLDELENIEGTGFPVGGTYGDDTGAIGTIVGGQYIYINENIITDGLYNITYQYRDEFGCSAIAEQTIEIIIITKVDNNNSSSSKLRVFPNPTSDIVYVKGGTIREVQIFDLLGKVNRTDYSPDGGIDLSTYPSGIYIMSITMDDGAIVRTKVKKI